VTTEYSEVQLDALRELANIGSGMAATAMSQMLGRTIDVSVPSASALPLADAVDAVGEPEALVTGVVLPVVGDFEAVVLLLFGESDATSLCGLLGFEPGSELADSALAEIGNILGTSYVNALVLMTGLELEPRPPEQATDMLAAVVSTVLASRAYDSDIAIVLGTALHVEDAECSFSFMLVPSATGVADLLARLGLGG